MFKAQQEGFLKSKPKKTLFIFFSQYADIESWTWVVSSIKIRQKMPSETDVAAKAISGLDGMGQSNIATQEKCHKPSLLFTSLTVWL